MGSGVMFILRRRSVAARSGVVAAVIGVLALTSLMSLPGAGAASSASRSTTATVSASVSSTSSSSAASAEGDTRCVPWGKGGLGLKCTGTYQGFTAWDPWSQETLQQEYQSDPAEFKNDPYGYQPTVTISQAKDLTDQVVQVNWYNFTPSIGGSFEPNPTLDGKYFQVSAFECNGANPDWSDGFSRDCYGTIKGETLGNPPLLNDEGPFNAQVDETQDGSPASCTIPQPGLDPACAPQFAYPGIGRDEKGDGGDPATWTGHANFHVEAPTPRSPGGYFNCSPSKPCSLVIDPNWGGTPASFPSNDYKDTSGCDVHNTGFGSSGIGDFDDSEFSGLSGPQEGNGAGMGFAAQQYYQSAVIPENIQAQSLACWAADRIVVPLAFEPTALDCPNASSPQFYATGSPMMELQMDQWRTGWCSGSAPVQLEFVPQSETVARDEFLGDFQAGVGGARIDMALVTLPPDANARRGSSRKFTYAPLANTGVGIAFETNDGNTGRQLQRMVLDPRLLAKLTTESYALQYGCTPLPSGSSPPPPSSTCDPAVLNNPQSVFDDGEFLQLNQDCQPYGEPAGYPCTRDDFPSDSSGTNSVKYGAFLPTVLAADSDMTYDMTGWIAANADAKRFLNGETDPWGMHVNKDYLHVSYPVQVFNTTLDPGWSNSKANITKTGCQPGPPPTGLDCTGNVPDATMQNAWIPQTNLDLIVTDLLTYKPTPLNNELTCGIPAPNICDSTDTLTFAGLSPQLSGVLALMSEADLGDIANYGFSAAELVNAAGKAVGPTQASVEDAVKDMTTNPDGITQYFNPANTDKNAYPLAMTSYAMVPTCGLSHTEASAIADFLTKAATTGQVQGEAPGQLGAGYYPLNAKQKAQTLEAAAEVRTQDCKSAPPDKTVDGHEHVNDTTPPARSDQSGGTRKSGGTAPAKKTPSSAARTPGGGAATGEAQTAAFGQKSADSGLAGLLLLLAIIAGALLLIGGPAAWAITATGKWPVVLRWLRPAQARLTAALGWLSGLVVRRA
jgi:hypothetical protein